MYNTSRTVVCDWKEQVATAKNHKNTTQPKLVIIPMYVSVSVCMCRGIYLCMYVSVLPEYVSMYVCMCVSMILCVDVCVYVLHACMYVCMRVCMYVCLKLDYCCNDCGDIQERRYLNKPRNPIWVIVFPQGGFVGFPQGSAHHMNSCSLGKSMYPDHAHAAVSLVLPDRPLIQHVYPPCRPPMRNA